MKEFFLYLVLIAQVFLFSSFRSKEYPVSRLQCEHLPTPLGVDVPNPRLSWQINNDQTGILQSAYRILLGTDSISLLNNNGYIWDSGKIKSDKQLVKYPGVLAPFTKYFWKVMVWDQKGREIRSAISFFEAGLITSNNWRGRWISDGKGQDYRPAPCFRKAFTAYKSVKSARAYIAAAGLFELSMNGKKVTNEMLNPMYTRYDKRNLYSTFDVTNCIKSGENVIGIILGNGWYNHQSTAVWSFDKAVWRNRPRFILNIRVVYEDGSVATIFTDENWKTADSPVIQNNIYTAEHYDANKELLGWDASGFNDVSWSYALPVDAPSKNIVSQLMYPIRVKNRLKPIVIEKKSDSCYLFTFPKNLAGVVDLHVKGKKNSILQITQTELLDKNGNPDMSNIDYHYRPTNESDPFQKDIFVLSGRSDRFSPKFNYKGFQYAEVKSNEPIKLAGKDITALEMHSDVPEAGYIHSSNTTLNKIWEATNNSYLSNLFGYPTDCPQREKNGWTGDAHIAVETGLYNFDALTIYEKWMNDFRDEQRANGVLPCIIPTSVWGYDWANGVDWTSAVAIIPWEIYRFYGDDHLLSMMYDPIKRYVNHIDSLCPDGITDWGLGDWIPVKSESNKELTTSLYYYNATLILAKAAQHFDKKEDAEHYLSLSSKIRNAINSRFLNVETGIYCSGTQTELAAPLFWGVVPENLRAKVAENLYKKLVDNGFHLDVGLLGAKVLLNALSENGYSRAAYKVAVQETYPSWGYWIKNGATTLFENWRIDVTRDASRNHIMFGEISAWMYKCLGGLFPDENYPGFKNFILKPYFFPELSSFQMRHLSPYGWILTSWRRKNNQIVYNVEIPANSNATLFLPDKQGNNKEIFLTAGKHRFVF